VNALLRNPSARSLQNASHPTVSARETKVPVPVPVDVQDALASYRVALHAIPRTGAMVTQPDAGPVLNHQGGEWKSKSTPERDEARGELLKLHAKLGAAEERLRQAVLAWD